MTTASPTRTAGPSPRVTKALLIVALLGPLAVVLGMFGARFGVWSAALIVNAAIYLWVAHERNALVANPPISQASSDWADRPSFSSEVMAQRRGAGAQPLLTRGDADWCPGLATVPRQAAPEEARAALEAANRQVLGVSPFRAEGQTSSFWYGFDQDVVIRIRPGATDVLVAGREDRADGGAACRTALAVADALAK